MLIYHKTKRNSVNLTMYLKEIFLHNFSEKNRIFLLSGLSLLTLISFGSFCYDNDPFDKNDLPDFSCQYPNISYQHDQVSFIPIQSSSNRFSLTIKNSLLTRSPPVSLLSLHIKLV